MSLCHKWLKYRQTDWHTTLHWIITVCQKREELLFSNFSKAQYQPSRGKTIAQILIRPFKYCLWKRIWESDIVHEGKDILRGILPLEYPWWGGALVVGYVKK